MRWRDLEREAVSCVLCGSDEGRLLGVWKSWPVRRCSVCGLVHLSERPVEASLEEMYAEEYYDGGSVGYHGYESTFMRYRTVFDDIFDRRARDLSGRVLTGRRLLEVGCAHGFLLDHLRRAGWDVEGVEVSPLAAGYAADRLGLRVHTGRVEDAPLPLRSFDAVLMLDVLEHLHRPFETLSRVSELLRPGGVLVVQCPWELTHWEESLQAVLRGRRTGSIEPDAVPAHLYFFSPRTLDAVLEKAGYEITGRQSGNYGEIRRRVSPPETAVGSPLERAFRIAYFRLGLQRVLYAVSAGIGLGNGLIRYAVPGGVRRRTV